MGLYLIIFHVEDSSRQNSLIEFIKQQGPWARIDNNVWCIKCENRTSVEIRDSLRNTNFVTEVDRLLVIDITKSPWASYYLPVEVGNWLKN